MCIYNLTSTFFMSNIQRGLELIVADISPIESGIYCFMNIVLTVLFIPKYLISVTPYKELLKICIFQFCPAFADEIFTSLSVRLTLDHLVIKFLLFSLQRQFCRPVHQHHQHRTEAGKSHFVSMLTGFLDLFNAYYI